MPDPFHAARPVGIPCPLRLSSYRGVAGRAWVVRCIALGLRLVPEAVTCGDVTAPFADRPLVSHAFLMRDSSGRGSDQNVPGDAW